MYEYKVVNHRLKWRGGDTSAQLETALNEYARQGWRARFIIESDSNATLTHVVFERHAPSAPVSTGPAEVG